MKLLACICLVLLWPSPCLGLDVQVPPRPAIGQAFVLRLESTQPLSELSLRWLDRELKPEPVKDQGRFVAEVMLGTDVRDDAPGVYDIRIRAVEGGVRIEKLVQVEVESRYFPTQELTLQQDMVTPPASAQARIERDQAETRRALDAWTPQRFWTLPLLRPVAGTIESPYGSRRILNGTPKSPHRGLDFKAAEAEPVRAVADGLVALASDQYYAGKCLILDHGNGVMSLYFHLSKVLAAPGARVRRGDMVGLVGSSGRATGPHLHMALSAQGRLVDPSPLFEQPR